MTNLEHDGLGVLLIVPCHVACSMLGAFMRRNSDLFHPFHEKKKESTSYLNFHNSYLMSMNVRTVLV